MQNIHVEKLPVTTALSLQAVTSYIIPFVASKALHAGLGAQDLLHHIGKPSLLGHFIRLVVEPPLYKIQKSVGMIIPNIWKNTKKVPNHQPVMEFQWISRDLWDFMGYKMSASMNSRD